MKTTVIHHSADFDGIFCREIARKFLPEAELIGWDFKDEPLDPDRIKGPIYILDLPVDRIFGLEFPAKAPESAEGFERIIWIDHHKSSIESHPKNIPGYRIDGVAACRLAWQWFAIFHADGAVRHPQGFVTLPPKQAYLDRLTLEPIAVRLAGEYDIWDRRDPNAELFQHGLRSRDLSGDWPSLLSLHPDGIANPTVLDLLAGGRALQYAQTQQNASVIQSLGFDLDWEGLKFLACNHARYNSHLFSAGLRPEHDACFGFKWLGQRKQWEVSLYHAPGKEHHDLSQIAVKHGGGGHRGACGFRAATLPFLT